MLFEHKSEPGYCFRREQCALGYMMRHSLNLSPGKISVMIRCNLLYSQQIPSPSKLGHSLLTLYSLERNRLITGTSNERKRVCKPTEKGIKTIETILNANDKIKSFITNILKVQGTS